MGHWTEQVPQREVLVKTPTKRAGVQSGANGLLFSGRDEKGMQEEEYEEWMSIDEDIPVAATLTDLEICQVIKVDDSDGDECVEENPPTNEEIRQIFDILKRGVQHRSTNFKKSIQVRTI
ncbi:hypothetical protein AVEN_274076-1 [Araneus ventricosus]|uniref:Uncharacterized protein n=1 Tax=Araneus ventricosus TaxID=182803 RepID=A0A4Y2KGL7_ARAVE|nr:hypothetical protein AVEN_274076-1 [Araneus ventricosus]